MNVYRPVNELIHVYGQVDQYMIMDRWINTCLLMFGLKRVYGRMVKYMFTDGLIHVFDGWITTCLWLDEYM